MFSPEKNVLPDGNQDSESSNVGKKYEHSGNAPYGGLALAYVTGAIIAAGAGVLYCFLVTNIDWVTLKIFIALGFAATVGLPIGWIAKKSKVRSDGHILLAVLLAATVGLYFCWAFHPYFAIMKGHEFIAWQPAQIYRWAVFLFNAGKVHSGWLAVGVWILEAGVVYLLGLGFAIWQVEQPFCEQCNCWTEKRRGVACYRHPGEKTPLAEQLKQNDYKALLQCQPSSDQNSSYLRVDMDMCPACLKTCVISCWHITTQTGKNGQIENHEEIVMDKIIIDPETLQDIIAAGLT